MPTPNPPTPRRCRRILEAHHVDCQGLSPEDIATKLRCARSTVYAYFRDFQLYRAHILRTVAADRLADQVHILTTPDTDPDQHRQTVAATRELRLLLQSLPAIEAQEDQQREPAYAEDEMFPDGHRRLINGPNAGQCATHCIGCLREHLARPADDSDKHPDEPGITEPEPDQSSQIPDESAPIQTNLDKSGQQIDQNPAPDNESAPDSPKSPPIQPIPPTRPRQPQNWPRITPPRRSNRPFVIPLPAIGRY
ncbi:MAG: hypothetical protein OXH19_06155 [Chloroflexi bacterium]|nr:hypothetical protein [Chloroflexota bacterium]MCY3589644.1 hypothetical protein [Chloroflexota bacterium]MCY3687154.1 hypothetical protein [Chloroflexota bacterium]MDE2709971.1 hypothetical protein [Chloroflexota bacterium]